jgi:hypothetical protein
MANEIQDLLNRIGDDRVRTRLEAAIGELKKTKKYGLVFEGHVPELLPIYAAKVRIGARVARKSEALTDTFVVGRVVKGIALVRAEQGGGAEQSIPIAELVVVRQFGEAMGRTKAKRSNSRRTAFWWRNALACPCAAAGSNTRTGRWTFPSMTGVVGNY